jgi:hypothetical protein
MGSGSEKNSYGSTTLVSNAVPVPRYKYFLDVKGSTFCLVLGRIQPAWNIWELNESLHQVRAVYSTIYMHLYVVTKEESLNRSTVSVSNLCALQTWD